MPSERIQRRIESFLDEADEASAANEWSLVADKARAVLAIDSDNEDAAAFLAMAVANGISETATTTMVKEQPDHVVEPASALNSGDPESFAGGRYQVLRLLGEGGKKRVFVAHDELLDRDIAFSFIKTEGLDDTGRERIMREARAMGRLTHQNIVSIYDIGQQTGSDGTQQPYLVQELMGGGDVERLLEDADGPLPLQRSLDIAIATTRGLEFAHAQGVVHRDLKPGNVWLTSDGEAKIGDLGLAVTLGQSRLTSHGMMVGTFQYMPPEQALGGESTPQADLYSLGAMLYEMVTGRTPFEGDTPTAVISQHLNTQPVAPSWHTEHCPPDLEALILRLLEKEPDKRPVSATEVRAVLEQVDPEARSVSHSDSQTNPLDRLAQGVFVGREKELEQLHEALNQAMEGRGSVVMLVGEPGIGKTRTVQELETYARMRGADVFWGRTHESSGMPAYWPWIQVGRAWGSERDLSEVGNQAGTLNPEMLRLFPELQRAAPAYAAMTTPEQQDPATAQFLLFDAYTQFVRTQAQQRPWVAVLDDLHWADKPTLQLLQYLARELSNMPVLIIGTYRDTDLVRTHPLSEALAELNRESGFLRVNLRGLERDEVSSYLRQRAGSQVSDSLLTRVFEETEGNPFFLSEVVNLMTEEGTLTSDSISDVALPDGVREALGRRLDRISEETNELLRTAALVGRDFAYDVLTLLDKRSADELLTSVEEALDARVIEELPEAGRYRFTHALMQETLLEELSTTRRVRIHGQVGEALEIRWGDDLAAARAPRLARHFTESSTLTDAHRYKALKYSGLAAEHAEAQSAWPEAVRHRENTVSLIGESDTVRLAAELTELGRVAQHAVEWRLSWRSLMQALDLYRAANDGSGFGKAATLVAKTAVETHRLESVVREALDLLGEQDPELTGQLVASLLSRPTVWPDQDELAQRLERLVTDTQSTELEIAWKEFQATRAYVEGRLQQSAELRLELQALHEKRADVGEAAYSSMRRAAGIASAGSVDDGIRELEAAYAYCVAAHQRQYAGYANQPLSTLYYMRGEFDDYAQVVSRIPEENFARELLTGYLHSLRGELERAVEHLPPFDWRGAESMMRAVHGGRARILWHAGREDEARRDYEALIRLWPTAGVDSSRYVDFGLICLDEAVAALASPDDLSAFTADFDAKIRGERQVEGTQGGAIDRLVAQIELARGDIAQARLHAARARSWCIEQRAIVEQARCEQLLADIELADGNREAALPLLDSAAAIYDRFGLGLYLEQVIAKKEILKA